MAIGDLAQGGEEAVRRNHVAAFAEDRLHDEGGHVVRHHHSGEQLVDGVQRPGKSGVVAAHAQRIRVRDEVHPADQGLEVSAVPGTRAGEG